MDFSGAWLRQRRSELGLSQARLSEVTGISQHTLSAVELDKLSISAALIAQINAALNDNAAVQAVAGRKKRYQSHSYQEVRRDPSRHQKYGRTNRNEEFLSDLRQLTGRPDPQFTGVSLFSGIGGFSCGFRSAGFDIKGFVEIDEKLADIYRANFPDVPQIGSDITQVENRVIEQFIGKNGETDVLIGGPPCQGFSLSGKRDIDDPRNDLFYDYMRFVDILKPKIAIIENVRLLTSMKSKRGAYVKDEISAEFRARGYRVGIFEVNAKSYGVPQHRERVLFMAFANSLQSDPTLPPALYGVSGGLFDNLAPFRTFGDACSDLPYLEAGETSDDPHHAAVRHPDHVIEWLWNVPEGASAHDNADPALRPPSGYNTTYKRQVWNEPASTVQTTFGMISGCRNVHPTATRSLTIREAARIQTFPDDYQFCGSLGSIRTGLGNAVPPLLARSVALHLRALLSNFVEVPGL